MGYNCLFLGMLLRSILNDMLSFLISLVNLGLLKEVRGRTGLLLDFIYVMREKPCLCCHGSQDCHL